MTMKQNFRREEKSYDMEMLSEKLPMFKTTYIYLMNKYNKYELTVEETLVEIGMSPSDFYKKKKKGKGIPCYRQKNARGKITFPIICITLFLSENFIIV